MVSLITSFLAGVAVFNSAASLARRSTQWSVSAVTFSGSDMNASSASPAIGSRSRSLSCSLSAALIPIPVFSAIHCTASVPPLSIFGDNNAPIGFPVIACSNVNSLLVSFSRSFCVNDCVLLINGLSIVMSRIARPACSDILSVASPGLMALIPEDTPSSITGPGSTPGTGRLNNFPSPCFLAHLSNAALSGVLTRRSSKVPRLLPYSHFVLAIFNGTFTSFVVVSVYGIPPIPPNMPPKS